MQSDTMAFDWHAGSLTLNTSLDKRFRITQNVRRFLVAHCGANFSLDREFRAWIRTGAPATLGELITEWNSRHGKR